MTPAERIQQLAGLLEGTSIVLLEVSGPDGSFRLSRDVADQHATHAPTVPAAGTKRVIPAPSVGTFRIGHLLQNMPLAQPGGRVEPGDVVGLVQVGTLYLHVLAPSAGTLLAPLAADGDIVGYGAPLFWLTEAQS